jgi:hypothetical protein
VRSKPTCEQNESDDHEPNQGADDEAEYQGEVGIPATEILD